MRNKPAIFALFLGIASAGHAQSVQPWPNVFVSAPIADKTILSVEGVGRIASDARTSQFETRLQIGRVLSPSLTVGAGWVHFSSFIPDAGNTSEEQAVEQLNWAVGSLGRVRVTTRTRLEQRFISNVDATSWRFRQQIRAMYPLGSRTAPSLTVWTEPFLALNRTTGQRRTLDQLRTFVGVTIPMSPAADVEFGYLNQRIYRANGMLVHHAVPLIFNYRF